MSNRNKSNQKGTDLSPSTVTVVETESTNALLPLEEKVIRMLHGLSEDDQHVLAFGVGASPETIEKLAHMEEYLISTFYSHINDVE